MSGHITRMSRGSRRRVVLEEPEQHLAEHLDLTGRPVAAVHLDRPVAVGEGTALGDGPRRRAGRPGASRAGSRGAWSWRPRRPCRGRPRRGCAGARAGRGRARRAAGAGPGGGCRRPARRRPLEVARAAPTGRSLGCGSHRWRSWWVASARSSSISVAGIRVWPNSEMRGGRSDGPARSRSTVAACRWAGTGAPTAPVRARQSGGCQARSVVEVAAEAVAVAAGGPVDQQLRPLGGVRREQAGEPARDGVAAAPPELRLVAGVTMAEVERQGGRPRLVEALVEHRQQGPGERVGRPRVLVAGAGQLGDQRPREPELDAGAHPVSAARRGAEPVREPLAEPPLHAAGRHEHQLGRERVVQRRRQQLAEGIGEQVGPRGAVEVEHHSATLCGAADARPRRQSPQKCSRSSSALAAASTAAMASGLPWNFR